MLLLAGTVPVMTFFVERWMPPAVHRTRRSPRSPPVRAAAREPVTGSQHYFEPRSPRPRTARAWSAWCCPTCTWSSPPTRGCSPPAASTPAPGCCSSARRAPPPSGDLLDLGCGYGPIACVLAARSPGATVWAVDVNERALALCAANAASAGPVQRPLRAPDDPAIPGAASPGSGPTRRSGSARARCTTCSAAGSPGSRPVPRATLVMGRNLGADSLHAWLERGGMVR